MSEQEGSPLRT